MACFMAFNGISLQSTAMFLMLVRLGCSIVPLAIMLGSSLAIVVLMVGKDMLLSPDKSSSVSSLRRFVALSDPDTPGPLAMTHCKRMASEIETFKMFIVW